MMLFLFYGRREFQQKRLSQSLLVEKAEMIS